MNSIVSYPDRGNYGKNTYRGNCSGKLIEDLIDQFKIIEISDYMCGSGTTEDVANARGITSHCYDLNRGFDLLTMDIPERNSFIFWHPPYGDMITYAGEQYSAEEVQKKYGFDPRVSDLSQIKDWDEFVEAMNYCCLKQYASLEKGGRLAVLMGDMKRKGKLYSMIVDIVKPGTLENIVIKAQHNCWSDSRTYGNRNFIPIEHEYLMIVRKDGYLVVPVRYTVSKAVELTDLKSPTWRDILVDVLKSNDGPMTLDAIYQKIEYHRRAKENVHWREKIRQTLRKYPAMFRNEQRGVYAVCA